MNAPSSQTFLAGASLLILGSLGAAMLKLPIPAANTQSVTFILGAIAGALTIGNSGKIADKITNSTGPGATVQADAPQPPKEP